MLLGVNRLKAHVPMLTWVLSSLLKDQGVMRLSGELLNLIVVCMVIIIFTTTKLMDKFSFYCYKHCVLSLSRCHIHFTSPNYFSLFFKKKKKLHAPGGTPTTDISALLYSTRRRKHLCSQPAPHVLGFLPPLFSLSLHA